MATFPQMAESWRIARLNPAKHIAHCVLDTDTYNEVDDQFALTYAFWRRNLWNWKPFMRHHSTTAVRQGLKTAW